jgi:hypothetical protein
MGTRAEIRLLIRYRHRARFLGLSIRSPDASAGSDVSLIRVQGQRRIHVILVSRYYKSFPLNEP